MKHHLMELLGWDHRTPDKRLADLRAAIDLTKVDAADQRAPLKEQQAEPAKLETAAASSAPSDKPHRKLAGDSADLDLLSAFLDGKRTGTSVQDQFVQLLDSINNYPARSAPVLWVERKNTKRKLLDWAYGWAGSRACQWAIAHPALYAEKIEEVE